MKKRHKGLLVIFFVVAGVPLLLWLSWLFTTSKPISIFLMDKTTYTDQDVKNRAINFALKHYRFVKPNGKDYDARLDYYGFFPETDSSYVVRDLSGLSVLDIQQLALQHHMAYYADSYGVFSNMWPADQPEIASSDKLYGGLTRNDIIFLDYMLQMKKLVIAEFIFLAPPTKVSQRLDAEKMLGISWTGWTGRFFHDLDVNSHDRIIPAWLPVLYEKQYGEEWAFKGAGVILVKDDETLIVLTHENHFVTTSLPVIATEKQFRSQYDVVEKVNYPGWFDITLPEAEDATVVSWFDLDVNSSGIELLASHGLEKRFPSVIRNIDKSKMYYFAGDFGQSPVKRRFVELRGARYMELFLADLNDPTDKSGFFLAFYLPLMNNILSDYQKEIINEW